MFDEKKLFYRHKVTGFVKALTDLDLEQFVALEFWEPITEEQYRQGLSMNKTQPDFDRPVPSRVPTTVVDWGPDFSVLTLQQVILISVAKLYEIEVTVGTASRAVDISRIFGIMDIASLRACTKMVLVGAKSGDRRDDWAAYTAPIDTIQLMNVTQVDESTLIRRTFQYGDKLSKKTAEALFPIFVQMSFEYRE